MLVGDVVDRNAYRFPSKIALIGENSRQNFAQFSQRVYGLANALLALGLSKGDKVAFLLPYNMPEAMEIILGVVRGGMVVVPLNSRFSPKELVYLINRCDVKVLILHSTLSELVRSFQSELRGVQAYISIGDATDMENYETLISRSSFERPEVEVSENDIAALIHTSGTTGPPKEAIWTHRCWLAGARDIVMKFQLTQDDVLLMFTPCYHIPFFWFNVAVFYMGGTIVTIRRPDPETILSTIEKEKITIVSHFVPTTLLRVLDYPELGNYNTSTVRYFMYGGSPMPIPILKKAIKLLGNKFIQLYGFTEQAGAVACLPPEDHVLEGSEYEVKRLSSCGKEMPSNDVRVVDKEGKMMAPGTVGELVVRGDNLAAGYWKEPEQTKSVFKDGWFHTGDLATIDEDKYIYIVGRSKDIIISGGENITPKQVEDVIYEHPAVEQVAVIGVPDPVWGEAVKAVVVTKKGAKVTEKEIIEWCKQRLAHYKAPKSVDFVSELPLTPTGKVKKWELKEKYAAKVNSTLSNFENKV